MQDINSGEYLTKQQALHERVERDTTYQPNVSEDVVDHHEAVRKEFNALAHYLVDNLPMGREQSLALTALEGAMMWSSAAIARDQSTTLDIINQ